MYGIAYGRNPWPVSPHQGRHDGFDRPAFAWVPSIAPSNLDQAEGFHPFWEGDLLIFTLKTQRIHRLRMEEGRIVYDEPIEFIQRIRYGLSHSATGNLFLWTDPGYLFRVWPDENAWRLEEKSSRAHSLYLTKKDQKDLAFENGKAHSALSDCLVCHTGGAGSPPVLEGIIGQPIASSAYKNYSEALLTKGGIWTIPALKSFLRDPQKFAPGTSMPDQGPFSAKALGDIIEALEKNYEPAPAD
jgi:cytochrome c2